MLYRGRLVLAVGCAAVAYARTSEPQTANDDVDSGALAYDVAVIGGGSSGSYAAARLKQEGFKVVVIEREGRLGGHVNTYRDPTTNGTFDYGVQIFSNISVVTDFFGHYGIPLVAPPTLGGNSQTIDFASGNVIPVVQNDTALGEGLLGYGAQVSKYPSINGKWDIPEPIPEDFLLPLGDFIAKYNLQSWAYVAYQYNQGFGNILAQPTMYMFRYFDAQQVKDIAESAFLVNGLQNNQALYDRVQAELGDSVLLNTKPTSIKRKDDCVQITAKSDSDIHHITAKKLLISIPPTAKKLSFLDLSSEEKSIFRQFNGSYYWNSIVLNSGLPSNMTYSNIAPQNPLAIPAVPGVYSISATPFQGAIAPYYGSDRDLPEHEVKADIIATIKRIRKGLNITVDTEPEFAAFNAHNPFYLAVSNEAIQNGFYRDLEALQGQKNTWYTGTTWNKPATSALWNFTEYELLPRILAELK